MLKDEVIKAIKEYVYNFDRADCVGVTLTMKQMVNNNHLCSIDYSQNLKHFLNVLNKKCFGSATQRLERKFNNKQITKEELGSKKLRVFAVLEKSKGERLHFHMILQNPYQNNPEQFSAMIKQIWVNTRWGDNHVYIDIEIDEGWGDYITKFNTVEDSVDWENCWS